MHDHIYRIIFRKMLLNAQIGHAPLERAPYADRFVITCDDQRSSSAAAGLQGEASSNHR